MVVLNFACKIAIYHLKFILWLMSHDPLRYNLQDCGDVHFVFSILPQSTF